MLLLLLVAIGIGLLYWAQTVPDGVARKLLEAIGTALLIGAVMELILRTRMWEEVTEQVLARVQLATEVKTSGLSGIRWFDDMPLKELFQRASKVRFVAIAAQPLFLGLGAGMIRAYLLRPETTLDLALCDPDNPELMAQLDREFGQPVGTRRHKILESISELRKVVAETNSAQRVRLHLLSRMPRYTLYEFDTETLFVPYLTHPTRAPDRIPAFLFEGGRVGIEFLKFDADAVFSAHSRRVDLATLAPPATGSA